MVSWWHAAASSQPHCSHAQASAVKAYLPPTPLARHPSAHCQYNLSYLRPVATPALSRLCPSFDATSTLSTRRLRRRRRDIQDITHEISLEKLPSVTHVRPGRDTRGVCSQKYVALGFGVENSRSSRTSADWPVGVLCASSEAVLELSGRR
ncbi:hypothetical protein KQX54_018096 [Cotesia glomerata]|uniref:Uncharacterized protein n=1 Tax=Cotesia glomerata TaxID=32391 RepID=A0AAV7HV53_COTGL|nr:hypothetical protein KQX54_018096 [Cotesia glomerata]